MEIFYPLFLISSLILSLISIRLFKPHIKHFGIKGIDINKEKKIEVPEAGGILLIPAIWIVSLFSILLGLNPIVYVFLFTITCFSSVGFFDDGFRLFKKEKGWARYVANRAIVLLLLTIPFTYLTLPLAVSDPGSVMVSVYMLFAGAIILITSSLANSFAGLNGWEVGSSLIVTCGLTAMVSFSQIYTSTLISLGFIMIGAQLALYYYNRYPARVFPGDSGTLLFGSFIGTMILFIDYWYIALGLFLPHIIDIILKIQTNPADMSQKKERPYVLSGGKLNIPKSGKLDFAKFLIKRMGPTAECDLTKSIHSIVIFNTFFWTLLYIIVKLI